MRLIAAVRVSLGLVAWAAVMGTPARAGDFEASIFAGPSVPTFEQTFQYDPGPLIPSIPGVSIKQEGVFALDAKGGLSAGGALAFFPSKAIGFELRLDTAGADVDVSGVKYTARVALPAPLPPLTTSVDLTKGQMNVDRLTPVSLGVKFRSPGPVRFAASGGISYLPKVRATLEQTIGLGIPSLPGLPPSLDLTTLSITAEGQPSENGSAWGWQAGAGFEVPVGKAVSVVVDARFFRFGKRTLTWHATDGNRPLSPLEERLLDLARERLPPVEFNPTFFQATAGLSVRF